MLHIVENSMTYNDKQGSIGYKTLERCKLLTSKQIEDLNWILPTIIGVKNKSFTVWWRPGCFDISWSDCYDGNGNILTINFCSSFNQAFDAAMAALKIKSTESINYQI